MSDDLYDSLEDECPDGKSYRDSFYLHQKDPFPIKRVSKFESITRHGSFLYEKDKNKEGSYFSPSCKQINSSHKSSFLPAVNTRKSLQGCLGVKHSLLTKSSDYKTLAEKGLLLNEDGSFTKSPRIDGENLPFITREYKNLVFQKQKVYDSRKTEQQKKLKQHKDKNMSKCTGNDKKNADTSLKSSSSCFSESPSKTNNLTDSMKKVLLQKKHLKNTSHGSQKQNPKFSYSETTRPIVNPNKGKCLNPLNKHASLITQKSLLSYAERQQLQNGYSPMCLRYGVKKITSETTRSNFGDSVPGRLSEVSSRVLSFENIAQLEDEENFYKEIIKMERNKSTKSDYRNVSERTFPSTKHSVSKILSLREVEKGRISGKSSSKQLSKPLCIDLKIDSENAYKNCKKFSLTQPSSKLSKTELVLKGKAYGNLANARNILKFKSQEKLSGRENITPAFKEDRHLTYKENSEFDLQPSRIWKESPPERSLKKKKNRDQNEEVFIKTGTRKVDCRNDVRKDKEFYLPYVNTSNHGPCTINAANLLRMHSCLDDFGSKKTEL